MKTSRGKLDWAAFAKDFGLLTFSLASGGPTVVYALWSYLRGAGLPRSGLLTSLMILTIVAAWLQYWKEHNSHKQEIEELKSGHSAKLAAVSRDWNGDWIRLETRFSSYDKPILASCYTVDGTESWSLRSSETDIHDFKELCLSGVALLRSSPGIESTFAELSRAYPNDYTVWLRFVRDLYGQSPSGQWRVLITGEERNGKNVKTTHTELSDLKKFCALACQRCAANALSLGGLKS